MRTPTLALAVALALASAGRANETKALGLIDHARAHFEANCLPCHQGPRPLPYPPGPPAFSGGNAGSRSPGRVGSALSPDEFRAVRGWLSGKSL